MYDFVRLSGFGRLRGVGHGVKLPGSIIGMLLLTAFLQMGWVKLRWVKGISDFLVSNMGFFRSAGSGPDALFRCDCR